MGESYEPQVLKDGGTLYPHDIKDYIRAIQAAPPDTLLLVGDALTLPEWLKCEDCGAEMDRPLARFHVCEKVNSCHCGKGE